MKSRKPIFGGAIAVLIVAGAAIFWYARLQTYHFATVTPNVLYRDGNRDLREFANGVRRANARTVVSLIDDRELDDPAKPQFRQEADYLAGQGIRHVRIAVSLGGWPSQSALQRFLSLIQDPARQPVLIHCAQGVRRTGMFVAAYEMSIEKKSKADTEAAVQSFGHSGRTLQDIQTFIENYDPNSRSLPTTLPTTGNE